MNDLTVFWHHLGREHGRLKYAEDIRKNSQEVIDDYIRLKENWIKNSPWKHQFFRRDEHTIVEISEQEDLIVVYMIDKGLQLSLNAKSKSKYPWWVIDIVEMVEISPNVYSAIDLFIDIKVFEDGRYQVLDIDEFETAIALGIIEEGRISKALKSFNTALSELNNPEHWPIPLIEVAEKIRSELLVKR